MEQDRGSVNKEDNQVAYWKENVRLLVVCIAVWAFVSFGCGILFVDWLNQFKLGGYPLGFWFAQQGAIYTFLMIIFFYAYKMNKLDKKYNLGEDE